MRIAIYSRKSVETDTGESIKNQINLCKEYFQRKSKDCIFEVFEDEGFSGKNAKRPDFQRMMELVKAKQFDIVAVYKVDRIARNIVDFVNTFDELDKMDVKLVSITEGFDPSTPVGKMMMMMLASFAEMERMNIQQRVKDNMQELAKLGRWSGGTPPTGYTTIKIKKGKKVTYLKLIQDESLHIKEIFLKYSQGFSTYEISKYFAAKGLNYPVNTIKGLLTNPTYLISTPESVEYLKKQGYHVYGEPNGFGFLPYNRRSRKKDGKKTWNNENKIVGISKHEAIIDLNLWIRVQEMLKEKATEPKPRESEFTWLAGLVKCKCGSGMFVSSGRKKKNGDKNYYFRCSAKKNRTNLECNNKFLRVDKAEESVLKYMKKLADKKYFFEIFKQKNNSQNITREIKSINKKIDFNIRAIDNLVNKLMLLSNNAGLAVTKKIEELTSQNNILKEQLLMLERKKILNSYDKTNVETLYNLIINFLNVDNIELRRFYAKNIIKSIVWSSDNDTLSIELLI